MRSGTLTAVGVRLPRENQRLLPIRVPSAAPRDERHGGTPWIKRSGREVTAAGLSCLEFLRRRAAQSASHGLSGMLKASKSRKRASILFGFLDLLAAQIKRCTQDACTPRSQALLAGWGVRMPPSGQAACSSPVFTIRPLTVFSILHLAPYSVDDHTLKNMAQISVLFTYSHGHNHYEIAAGRLRGGVS